MIAALWNALGRRKLPPSSANDGKRALIFFAILIAVVGR
jgi:hypothetical protein